jgi:prevent-host-death family protein
MLPQILPILPISDLRNQAKEAISQAQRQPVVITQNGRPSAVLLNYRTYNELVSRLERLEREREGERRNWSALSEESLMRVWDNPADAAYDDWRTLYGV